MVGFCLIPPLNLMRYLLYQEGGSDARIFYTAVPASVAILYRYLFISDFTWRLRSWRQRWDLYGDLHRDTLVSINRQVSSNIQEACACLCASVLGNALLKEVKR